jgi:hypothetical protein
MLGREKGGKGTQHTWECQARAVLRVSKIRAFDLWITPPRSV